LTSTNGATASIAFNGAYSPSPRQKKKTDLVYKGTAFSIFGGHRSNYGAYTVTLDGVLITSGTSQRDNPSVRQLLGTASRLPYGLHTVVLTNTGGSPIDIDSVEFIGQVGQAG